MVKKISLYILKFYNFAESISDGLLFTFAKIEETTAKHVESVSDWLIKRVSACCLQILAKKSHTQ